MQMQMRIVAAAVAVAMVVEVVVVGSIGARTLWGVATAAERIKEAVVRARVAEANPLSPLVGVSAGLASGIPVRVVGAE
jgi:hypothetical protein